MNPDIFLDTVAKTVIHKSCVEFGRSFTTLHCRWETGCKSQALLFEVLFVVSSSRYASPQQMKFVRIESCRV